MDGRAGTADEVVQDAEGLRTGNDEGPAGERPAVPVGDVITRAVADDAPLPLDADINADHAGRDTDTDTDDTDTARADDDGLAPAFEAPEPA